MQPLEIWHNGHVKLKIMYTGIFLNIFFCFKWHGIYNTFSKYIQMFSPDHPHRNNITPTLERMKAFNQF